MNKINFENLPSTTTPINASNLNLLQTNVEDAINAVVESGSNTNGNYVKFADGTMISYLNITVQDQGIGSSYGSLYLGQRTWTFPQSFYSKPVVFCGMFKWGTSASWGGVSSQATTSGVTLYGYDFFSRATGTICYIQAMAIGRWKA